MIDGISHGFEGIDFCAEQKLPEVVQKVEIRGVVLRLRWAKVITEPGALALLAELK